MLNHLSLNDIVPETHADNSLADILTNGGGHHTSKTITLSANNTTASENIFQITSSIEILGIYGFITDASTLANLTAGFLEADDGTAQVDITASGIVLSGLAVDTFFLKDAVASSALSLADNAAVKVTEPVADKNAFSPFFVTQKTGVDTFIRFTYSTTDAPINAQIEWHVNWRHVNGGSLTAV